MASPGYHLILNSYPTGAIFVTDLADIDREDGDSRMLAFSRKTDYALIALTHMAQHPDECNSAREIANRYGVPLPLLMNILKSMNTKENMKKFISMQILKFILIMNKLISQFLSIN